jgi:hypothetical protein
MSHVNASVVVVGFLLAAGPLTAAAGQGIQITEHTDRLRVELDGELFTEYHFDGGSRPYLYPILAPGGARMTRQWPIEPGQNEEEDHVHHRAWWYAHGDINGVDFWSESAKAGRTLHDKFLEITSGPDTGVIRSTDKLVDAAGKIIATDERRFEFHRHPKVRMLDFAVTISASEGDLVFGDTKEGTMAIRLAETMRLKPNAHLSDQPHGHIVNSEGDRDGDTWGKRARWVDYYGPVGGKIHGVAIFDHPKNPRYPTWWHVRDYGLFAANPFGIHDFEKKEPGAGNLRVQRGQSITFRYRFIFHRGNEKDADIARLYEEYAR